VLFPTKHGLVNKTGGADWNRPLGLLAKKKLEDDEPLSKRRNRLMGVEPDSRPNTQSQPLQATGEQEGKEHPNQPSETLAQRTHRLKTAKALNNALGEGKFDGFGSDMMSQFGGLQDSRKVSDGKETAGQEEAPEEETLGQRRKRLQAQANGAGQARPQTKTALGLANNLSAGLANTTRQMSRGSSPNGLVGLNAEFQAQRRNHMTLRNQLSSSDLLETPLIDPYKPQQSASRLVNTSQQSQDAKRQYLLDHNQRPASPLVGQQRRTPSPNSAALLGSVEQSPMSRHPQIMGHNAHGQVDPRSLAYANQIQPQLRQTRSFMSGRLNDGSGGELASGSLTLLRDHGFVNQPQTYVRSNMHPTCAQQPAMSAYGQYPMQYPQQQAYPYMGTHMMQQTMPSMQQYSVQQMHDMDAMMRTTRQRENIDRWRTEVMP